MGFQPRSSLNSTFFYIQLPLEALYTMCKAEKMVSNILNFIQSEIVSLKISEY